MPRPSAKCLHMRSKGKTQSRHCHDLKRNMTTSGIHSTSVTILLSWFVLRIGASNDFVKLGNLNNMGRTDQPSWHKFLFLSPFYGRIMVMLPGAHWTQCFLLCLMPIWLLSGLFISLPLSTEATEDVCGYSCLRKCPYGGIVDGGKYSLTHKRVF